ncbi:MAG: hypothetical protein SPL13_05280 [Clostridia bacterium]|nr:hypothetical protein [Clostridia bacterium]
MDKSKIIFGNEIDKKTIKKAEKSKRSYVKKFGDDSGVDYKPSFKKVDALDFMGVKNIVMDGGDEKMEDNPLIVGNIRMGFGHYRISMAMASCAKALGFTPYWMDLASFDATGSKMIRKQNDMYSLASKISQKSWLFNKLVWEPLNSEGFKKITYNAKDQKNSELLVPLFKNIDKDVPFIATHVWPSQAAVHAGMKHVVNAIPDNWAMGLHLSEGAIHAVQTPFAYFGYKTLNGFAKTPLKGIPESDLKQVGKFIDHELLVDLKADNERRLKRINGGAPIRILMTVGGAGAGFDMFLSMLKHLLPMVRENKVAVIINMGDHLGVYEKLLKKIPEFKCEKFFNDYKGLKEFAAKIKEGDLNGITAIYNENIFEAVYATNLLMPVSDLLITKPSELAYYPIPKLFMKHIGGHEVYGAINGREYGDSSPECPDKKSANDMLDKMLTDKELLSHIVLRINELYDQGYYNGAYECVRLAAGIKK